MSTSETREQCEGRLASLLEDQREVTGTVVATEDGHVLAARARTEMGEDRVGAMSSSLVGLGATMAQTVGQGDNEFVIVQNREGYVATLRIDSRHLLTVAAKGGINLGMLLTLARNAAEDLAGLLQE